jgi:hypothetical protein
VKEEGTEWREIYKEPDCTAQVRSTNFLTDDLLAVRSCNKVTLFDTDGRVLLSKRFARKYRLEDFSASANGQRFEMAVAELKEGSVWGRRSGGTRRIHATLIVHHTESHRELSNFV